MFDIEVTQPVQSLIVSPSDAGVAVLIRRRDVPIGFWMRPLDRAKAVAAALLAQRIVTETGTRLLAEAIRDELS